MPTLDELLGQLDKNRGNAFRQAPILADAITQYQKQQRAAPYAQVLQQYSNQWASADPTQRSKLNEQANAVRAAYIESGGSPIDLDRSLWGSDPTQGFQTGAGQFTPSYAGDNLSYGQKERIAGLTGNYEGKPTWNRQLQEAALTQIFNGEPTWDRQVQEQELELNKKKTALEEALTQAQINRYNAEAINELNGGSSGGGGLGGLTQSEKQALAQASFLENLNKRYQQNRSGENVGDKANTYPGYYVILSALQDPELQDLATKGKVDVKKAVDEFIIGTIGMTPDEYFRTPQGSKIKKFYDAKFNIKNSNNDKPITIE